MRKCILNIALGKRSFFFWVWLCCAQYAYSRETKLLFEYYQGLVFLHAKVNNTDGLLFLMDTGANASAIDSATADRLGLKTIKTTMVEGTAGSMNVPNVKLESLSVQGMPVKDLVVTKYNLSGSLAPPGKHLDGILGTDFLKHFALSIDFQSKVIDLSDKKINAGFRFVPLELNNNIPRIKVKVNDTIATYLRYDSGASLFETNDIYINIPQHLFEQVFAGAASIKPVFTLSGTGVGGEVSLPVYKAKSVTANNVEIKEPYLVVQPPQGYFARKDAVGFFSNNLVEKYRKVIIDFIARKMYFIDP